jgi:hypothetical protein
VVDDQQIPESGKRSRKRDGAVAQCQSAGAFDRDDLDAI